LLAGDLVVAPAREYFGCAESMKQEKGGQIDQDRPVQVILLHGLARTRWSMHIMEKAVIAAGYISLNLGYPSRSKRIEDIVDQHIIPAIKTCCDVGSHNIHFVTHSMGGIVLRLALQKLPLFQPGRVVMLSPPNQGSLIAQKMKNWWLFKLVNGPAGQQLGVEKSSLPVVLGPVDYETGIITGTKPCFFDRRISSLLPQDNDGKVGVEEAKVEGMKDFLLVPQAHPFIMNADQVIRETLHFLQTGTFSHVF